MSLATELDDIYSKNKTLFLNLVEITIKNRHMELINLLLDTKAAKEIHVWFYDYAVLDNHFDIVKLIYERLGVLTVSTCYAAEKNNLEMLKWLYEHGAVLDVDTFSIAVYYSSLDIIQWLYDNECPYEDWDVYFNAACRKNIDILQWLKDHNFTWNDMDCITIRGLNKTDLQWIVDNKHLFGDCTNIIKRLENNS